MKSYNEIESAILDSSERFKVGFGRLLNNMGRAVALIAALVAVLVTFTEVAFSEFRIAEVVPTLIAMLTCSYIIYFSLEDAGEKLGEGTQEYKAASERFEAAKAKISGSRIEDFRSFCAEYSRRELEGRRKRELISLGIGYDRFLEYMSADKKSVPRQIRKIIRMKPTSLSVKQLLTSERTACGNELENPERKKLPMLLLKLVPSTLCMLVTVSVILTVKADMTATDVFNGILKLTALPLIGFKGYSAGYSFAKNTRSLWLSTRAGIIESFLADKE